MSATKIVLIGAGSTSFGASTLADLFQSADDLCGSTVALRDLNADKHMHITQLAQRLNDAVQTPFVIESARDYRDVLAGGRFLLVSVEVDRLERWQLDWQIPLRYGIRHVLGENGGPGGLFGPNCTCIELPDALKMLTGAPPISANSADGSVP